MIAERVTAVKRFQREKIGLGDQEIKCMTMNMCWKVYICCFVLCVSNNLRNESDEEEIMSM